MIGGKTANGWLAESAKKLRYVRSFVTRRLLHANLQILYRCDFRCRICDFWSPEYRDRPLLSVRDARVIAEKLASVGPMIVSIGGGEPLLHPRVVDIVSAFARRHFPVMITNGWHVTPEKARALFEAGAYEVSVSIDYAEPERHDAQRGVPGAYDRAVRALRTLDEARTRPWQRVHMITVVMDDNHDEIEPLIRLSRELGVTYLVTLYSDGRGRLSPRNGRAEIGSRLVRLKRRYPDFVQLRGYVARFTRAARNGGIGPCYAGRHLLNVDCDGNVGLCIDRLDDPVGNLLTDDMRTIESRLREAQRRNRCRACWTSCRGAIETLLYGSRPLSNLLDYRRMTRPIRLGGRFA